MNMPLFPYAMSETGRRLGGFEVDGAPLAETLLQPRKLRVARAQLLVGQ